MVNTAATSEDDTRGWDLLLYMSSENSLLAESMKNIQDIRDNAQTPLMNVVIFQDQETRTNLETLRGGSIRTTVKKGQVDFSDPATLRGFLDEAQGEFPDGGPGKILDRKSVV